MDTHLSSNCSRIGKRSNRNGTQNISHLPPNNDHKVKRENRNRSQNINGGHEMGYDVRCTRPNRRYTWHWIFRYILLPLHRTWYVMYLCKRYYGDISFYKIYLNFVQSYVEAYKCFNIAKYIGKMSQDKRQRLFRALEICHQICHQKRVQNQTTIRRIHLKERNLK